MFMLFFVLTSLFLAMINIALSKKQRTLINLLEIFIAWFFLINVGLGGLFAFYGHAFRADQVALSIGWGTGSPFQAEVAAANLAFGLIGIFAFWLRGSFWLAGALGWATWLLGCAVVHIRQIISAQNFAVNNAGVVLWLGDIALPLLLLLLVILYSSGRKKPIKSI